MGHSPGQDPVGLLGPPGHTACSSSATVDHPQATSSHSAPGLEHGVVVTQVQYSALDLVEPDPTGHDPLIQAAQTSLT